MSWGVPFVLLSLVAAQFEQPAAHDPSPEDAAVIRQKLDQLNERVLELKNGRGDLQPVADVEVYAKAADWILRHHEFFEPSYAQRTIKALDTGLRRAEELRNHTPSWLKSGGSTVLGYYSRVDESVQPFAVRLPRGYEVDDRREWPLHVVLHGRNAKLNEVQFIHEFDGVASKDDHPRIELEIFGRTNNAYRWAGETDVFEALESVQRRLKIDSRRITLRGFSMGGAGTWHLGMHHPSLWSSVAAGAGFVDTVHHLKLKSPLSPLHQRLVKIYDAQEYALNAFDVPTVGYGGDQDPQLFAAQTMRDRGKELGVSIELLVGPQTGHKFHPDSLREYMTFIARHSQEGRRPFPGPDKLKFITFTPKYQQCDWLTVVEQIKPYEASTVEAEVDHPLKTVAVRTKNIAVLRIHPGVAESISIDGGPRYPLEKSVGEALPGIYFEKQSDGWRLLDGRQSVGPESGKGELRKRHDLQGPIDDAFMQPFLCVKPTGLPWSDAHAAWARWTLERFQHEFDHRLRGKIPVVDDTQVTEQLIADKHLILFGDPGSNAILARMLDKLPVNWTKENLQIRGRDFSPTEHGLSLIYPNPLNPRRYVVINSGHTFHESEFQNSNAALYPRLGDVAVIRFAAKSDGIFQETVEFNDIFDSRWQWVTE